MTKAITGVATGLDLKLIRVERGITQTALARRMGCWRQTVSILEGALRPKSHQIERYLSALDEVSGESMRAMRAAAASHIGPDRSDGSS